jgi:hypothetical protein
MKSNVSLVKEADDLQKVALSLRETFVDEAVIQHRRGQDWYDEASRFYAWYYRVVQVMTESGFAGLSKFQALCEDNTFSMLDFYTALVLGRKPEEGWRDELYPRFSQMHFILGALPAAVKSADEREARGVRAVSILDRLGDVSEIQQPTR